MDQSIDKQKTTCDICSKKLKGVFSSEHQCKRCLRTVCKDCCSKKKPMFTKTNMKLQQHRFCDACYPESQNINQYIKQSSLGFNYLSAEGKQWSQLADIDVIQHQKVEKNMKNTSNLPSIQDFWAVMTPSQRQFTGLLINKIPPTTVDSTIKYVFSNLTIPLKQGQSPVLLITYLLCYCDTTCTIKIHNYLTNISQSVDEDQIISYIQLLCQNQKNIHSKTIKMLFNYAKNVYKSLSFCYLLDCLSIDIVHHLIIQTLLSGNAQILQLSISCLIVQYREQILSDKFDQKGLKNYIYQKSNLKNIEKSIKMLRKLILQRNSKKKANETKQITKQVKESYEVNELETKTENNSKEQRAISFQFGQLNQKIMIPNEKSDPKEEQVLAKLNQASQFMKKLESGQLHEEDIDPQDLQSMERYLDLVIEQNDKALKECQLFEDLLNQIEDSFYNGTKTDVEI